MPHSCSSGTTLPNKSNKQLHRHRRLYSAGRGGGGGPAAPPPRNRPTAPSCGQRSTVAGNDRISDARPCTAGDEWKLQFTIKTTSKKKEPRTIKVWLYNHQGDGIHVLDNSHLGGPTVVSLRRMQSHCPPVPQKVERRGTRSRNAQGADSGLDTKWYLPPVQVDEEAEEAALGVEMAAEHAAVAQFNQRP